MTRLQFLLLAILSLGLLSADRPNIVVLYSDDAGYADFGFQPNVAEDMKSWTPNIDKIANEGARFTNAYMSACVCSPSRAGLMTGRYQGRFGYDNNLPPGMKNGLSLKETFISKRLQKLGYKTGLVGKWHLGYPQKFHPNKRGWDWFYGLLQGSRGYFPYKNPSPHRVIQENGQPTPEEGYVTDRFGDAACRFIEENHESPFYLFVSFTAPHGPLQPKEEDYKKLGHIKNVRRRKFAGLVVSLDQNVGKILASLKKHKVEKNTLVLFTNDNGGQTQVGANNTPLRGRKGNLYEGGIRVPWAMRWPKKIQPKSVVQTPVVALDLAPTFFTLAGGQMDETAKFDGVDFSKIITGEQKNLPLRKLYWRKGGSNGDIAIRHGKWKLIQTRGKGNSKYELYNLEKDLSETEDIQSANAKVFNDLKTSLVDWEKLLIEPYWGPGAKGYKPGKRKRKK